MNDHWYALHVKPHKERPVSDLLEAKDFEVYYPFIKVEPVNPRSRKERPFFPGYLFVKVDLDQERTNILRWAEGVHGPVEFGGEPALVPEKLLDELRRRLTAYEFDLQAAQDFEPGERVRIVDGLFDGYEAIFDSQVPGKDRVQVLLTYLSHQPKRVRLRSSDISKVDRRYHGS